MMLGAFGLMGALGGEPTPRGTGALSGAIAPFSTYRTRDGRAVALAALEPKFWFAFCGAVGIEPDVEALVPGPHQAAWKARLEALFSAHDLAHWAALADEVDCCLEPVLEPEELIDDPQHAARGMFVPTMASGRVVPMPRTPIAAHVAEGEAPTQGRDTRAVLADAGWAEVEIDALVASGAAR